MYNLSSSYLFSHPRESWSSSIQPNYGNSTDPYYISQPKIHSGMNVEELKSLTKMRMEGKNVYYDLPSQPMGVYGLKSSLLVPSTGFYYDDNNYSYNDEMDEVRVNRAWSTFSKDSTDSPSLLDSQSDHENSPMRTFSLTNPSKRHFSEADGLLRSSSFLDPTNTEMDDTEVFNCGSPNNPIDIDAFFDFKSNYFDVCAQHLKGSYATSSPIHA